MLILTRHIDESIMIGGAVSVAILSIKGTQVRVGFNAPKEMPVHRKEVYERIQRNAQRPSGDDAHPRPD